MILDILLDVVNEETKRDKAALIDEAMSASVSAGNVIRMIFDDMKTFLVSVVRVKELAFMTENAETPTDEDLEELLNKLADRKLTGGAAINACCNLGSRLNQEQFDMFCDVLQKNPRLGIDATGLNKYCKNFEVKQFKVHLCLALKKAKGKIAYDKYWFAQGKVDGNRIICEKRK